MSNSLSRILDLDGRILSEFSLKNAMHAQRETYTIYTTYI